MVDITAEINYSITNSKLYTAEILDDLLLKTEKQILVENRKTIITVENCTSMKAAGKFDSKDKIGCLNFASVKMQDMALYRALKRKKKA